MTVSSAHAIRTAVLFILISGVWVSCLSCRKQDHPNPGSIPVYGYRIVHKFPHDPSFWTQGLVFDGGFLYEGTGEYGGSGIFKIVPSSGQILQSRTLESEYFGEGITIFANHLIQLTWKSHIGFVYDKDSFALLDSFAYSTEGWGLTHNGRELILSDGTDTLYFLDPNSFAVLGQIKVTVSGKPLKGLNELEFVNGRILANVWQSDRIALIHPESGIVTAWIDLAGLLDSVALANPVDVLNGIAWNPKTDRLFVTGKFWPVLFEIEVVTNPPQPRP